MSSNRSFLHFYFREAFFFSELPVKSQVRPGGAVHEETRERVRADSHNFRDAQRDGNRRRSLEVDVCSLPQHAAIDFVSTIHDSTRLVRCREEQIDEANVAKATMESYVRGEHIRCRSRFELGRIEQGDPCSPRCPCNSSRRRYH